MKILAITDEYMNVMFQLIGVETREIPKEDPKEYEEEFKKILQEPDIGIIIITEQDLMRHRDFFKQIKMQKTPIIIEVPKLSGALEEGYFEEFIRKYIGLTL